MFDTFNTNYHICEEIGRGRFGSISRCFSPSKSNFFAVKTINKTLLTDTLDRECLQNEAKIMQLLSPHPNIVEIEDVFDTEENLYMVMELCEKETLYDKVVKSNGGLCEAKAASIMKQLLNGIAHCHRFGVVHRDLKPDNVLFGPRNVVKLADFGSADWIAGDDVGGGGGGGESLRGVVGTPYYVAPEVIMGRDYNEKVDVWSAGVVLYVMLSGMPPFYGETVEEIFEAVARGNLRFPIRVFKNVSSGAKDLIRKMVCRDVSRRFSAEQALRHPWILNGGEETMLID